MKYLAPGDPRRPVYTRVRQYVDELRENGLRVKRVRMTPADMADLVKELGCFALFIRDGVLCQFHEYGRGPIEQVEVVASG